MKVIGRFESLQIVVCLGGSIVADELNAKLWTEYARVINELKKEGHKLNVVVGAGKIKRDYISLIRELGGSESLCDEAGIYLSRINALTLLSALGSTGYPLIPENLYEALPEALREDGRIVVMGGTFPGQSTVAVAAQLAEATKTDLLIRVSDVAGVYNMDPKKNKNAQMFDEITPDLLYRIFEREETKAGTFRLVDPVFLSIIERSGIKVIFIDGKNAENLKKAIEEKNGTIVFSKNEYDKNANRLKDVFKALGFLIIDINQTDVFVRQGEMTNFFCAANKEHYLCISYWLRKNLSSYSVLQSLNRIQSVKKQVKPSLKAKTIVISHSLTEEAVKIIEKKGITSFTYDEIFRSGKEQIISKIKNEK